jgi:hypothetical protein
LRRIALSAPLSERQEFQRSAATLKPGKGCFAPRAQGGPFLFSINAQEKNEMSTPAQIAANQANAKLSTGPTSVAGKQIASQNSVKHHLTGKGNPALPGEEDAVAEHVEGFIQAYAPVGVPERTLVINIAENHWRLSRAHALETALFTKIMMEQSENPASALADAWLDAAKGLKSVATYAARIQRAIEKNTAELKSLQAERKTAYAKAEAEAMLLTQLAHAKGQTVDAAKDFPPPDLCGGFVYSLPEIARLIGRAARLEEAKARFLAA